MQFHVVLLLVFISVSAAVFFILGALSRRSDSVSDRLRHVESLTESFQQQFLSLKDSEKSRLDPKLFELLSDMARHIRKDDSDIRKRLIQAGYHRENGVQIFFGMKMALAITLFILYALLGFLKNPGPGSLFIALAMSMIGYLVPNLVLSMKIRNRQDAINSGLPDALDFLVICVEAGLGLNSALVRVGKEMVLRCRELSEEFLLVNQEMRTGFSREQALHNLSERNRSKHLRILVSAVIISDRLGTNIADTLRAQSDSLRTQFRQQAEEQAAKAGIKMLFPLVFLILPTLFIIILGPAVILMLEEVFPVINK